MNRYPLQLEVLQINVQLEKPTPEPAPYQTTKALEQFFDTLVKWCDERQLFIGGSLEVMVIYAPLRPMTTQQRRQLRQLIEVQAGVTGCQLKVVCPSSVHSLRVKAACLEALSQAQRDLADRMADCADALAGLVPSASRSWRASVGDAGQSLMLQSWPLHIGIAILRLNKVIN